MTINAGSSQTLVSRARFGSALSEKQSLWAAAYESRLQIIGTTGIIIPIGDDNHQNGARTTVTTVGEEQVVFTYSKAIDTWDSPLGFEGPSGGVPVITFDGVDEEADSPDAAYWSNTLDAMSWAAWVDLTDATSSTFLAKYTESGNLREWRFHLTSGDDLQFIISDEDDAVSPNATLDSLTDTAISESTWVFLTATYDGSANASGINLYVDGALVASTDTDDANFTSGRDTTATVELGMGNGANFFDGKMAGGPLGPVFTKIELTADQILRLYQHDRALLGV